ncbi:Excinuclease ABC subunit A [Dissulfuribacter thermophilus]|uniref:UvrABC system protein A n=1 Tax=Dissulfuribacter thermophilus TaxID=1156395 RepID=A0A1B9F772_9BACT|nr:AAA family ATPase [Dissulfuribacter thermophilus]OCC15762.1 Excinuclease ABC subunit A [Dissulfuribacter thermophilus]
MEIVIRGVFENNLKIDELRLPLWKVICLIGPSGSGKSTLAREVLYKEGKRLYLEGLGLKAEQWSFNDFHRPKAEFIKGLPPTIYLDQIPERFTSRSSLASYADLSTPLRLLFSILGQAFCPSCNIPIKKTSISSIKTHLLGLSPGTPFAIMTPIPKPITTIPLKEALEWIIKQGFVRIEINDEFILVEDISDLDKVKDLKKVNIVIDRLILKEGVDARIEDAIRVAESLGSRVIRCLILPKKGVSQKESLEFSLDMTCPRCLTNFPELGPHLLSRRHPLGQCPDCKGSGCNSCDNTGLSPFSRTLKLHGLSYTQVLEKNVLEVSSFLNSFSSSSIEHEIAGPIYTSLKDKLATLQKANLSYLELSRPLTSISRGELQRLRICVQIHRALSGTLVILDEPTIGLHPKEFGLLKKLVDELKATGNTVLIIEHDESILKYSDWVCELGPGSGERGGKVVFNGPVREYLKTQGKNNGINSSRSVKKDTTHNRIKPHRAPSTHLTVRIHNEASIKIPLNAITVITGVSGSGKTTFAMKTLVPKLKDRRLTCHILDQSPLRGGKTSLISTYLGIFTEIRELFSKTKEARLRGFMSSFFSLSKDGGRCAECKGTGYTNLDLKYLPPIDVKCPICDGRRYREDVMKCYYKGKNIHEVLSMTVGEAVNFFSRIPAIRSPLQSLVSSGLHYLVLGQPISTLSGGERMRLRLSLILSKKIRAKKSLTNHALILDEPSAGLYIDDLRSLVNQIKTLVNNGMTVIIIDHEELILDAANMIIEFEPGGGPSGGRIINATNSLGG